MRPVLRPASICDKVYANWRTIPKQRKGDSPLPSLGTVYRKEIKIDSKHNIMFTITRNYRATHSCVQDYKVTAKTYGAGRLRCPTRCPTK